MLPDKCTLSLEGIEDGEYRPVCSPCASHSPAPGACLARLCSVCNPYSAPDSAEKLRAHLSALHDKRTDTCYMKRSASCPLHAGGSWCEPHYCS